MRIPLRTRLRIRTRIRFFFCEFKLHYDRFKLQFTLFEFLSFLGEVSTANGHKDKAPRAKRAKNQQSERTHSKVPLAVGTQCICDGLLPPCQHKWLEAGNLVGCPTVRGCIVRYPYVSPPYYGALFVGDGVSLPIPPQFGCDECILTHITLYLNQKGGKSRAKLVGSSWYLTPLLWDTLIGLLPLGTINRHLVGFHWI